MPNKLRQQQTRQRIAAVAARLMAEDGIDDFAHAKRKAARQLGVADTHALPNNEEIEAELRAYQSLYQDDEQRDRLQVLRSEALEVMRLLEPFHPYLTGSVLRGTAPRYADVDLELFTDDAKAAELLLLARELPYTARQVRRHLGDGERLVPQLVIDRDGFAVNVTVYAANDERLSPKRGASSERANLKAVAELVGRGELESD